MDPVHDVAVSFADFGSGHRNEQLARALLAQHRLEQPRRKSTPETRQQALKLPTTVGAAPISDADIARLGTSDPRRDRAMLERATAAVRDSLLEAAQAAAEASRRARALAEALDQSLTLLAAEDSMRTPPPATTRFTMLAPAAGLSEREREVLTHVAAGRSNKDIARVLYLSPNTVKSHVSSLLRKMNANSRAQLATFAVQQGLGA